MIAQRATREIEALLRSVAAASVAPRKQSRQRWKVGGAVLRLLVVRGQRVARADAVIERVEQVLHAVS